MDLIDYILENKNEILDIFQKYQASNVIIIGSVSKRKEHSESDIDFVADLRILNNGLVDVQAYADLVKELSSYFDRKIELATHQQIQKQYPDALEKGINLRRSI